MAGDESKNENENDENDRINFESSPKDFESSPKENQTQEEEEEEYRIPNHPPVPYVPKKGEWIEHQITHMPYKPWCPICVKRRCNE